MFSIFSRKSDMDTATDHEQGKGFELRLVSFNHGGLHWYFFLVSQAEEKLNLYLFSSNGVSKIPNISFLLVFFTVITHHALYDYIFRITNIQATKNIFLCFIFPSSEKNYFA
jgi:hypothetical protein